MNTVSDTVLGTERRPCRGGAPSTWGALDYALGGHEGCEVPRIGKASDTVSR
jgi:hypothetical protein